jgi:hypothetical protein
MPRSTLPASSLPGRFGSLKTSLLVVSEVGPKYLIWIASLTRRLSICGSESIFLPAFREAECASVATCGWMASLVGEAGRGRADAPSDGLPSKLCATRRARRRVQRMAEGEIPRSANPTHFWSRQDTSTSAAKGRPFGLLLW